MNVTESLRNVHVVWDNEGGPDGCANTRYPALDRSFRCNRKEGPW